MKLYQVFGFLCILICFGELTNAQTFDNPTVVRIGTCQSLVPIFGEEILKYALSYDQGLKYFVDYHVKTQGPFLINGNYYTFDLDVREFLFDPELMFQQYGEMYQDGYNVFLAPLYFDVFGTAVQDFFAALPVPPPLLVTSGKEAGISPFPNTFAAGGNRLSVYDSTLRAVISMGVHNISCLWSVSDAGNYEACYGAFATGRSLGIENSGIIHPTTYDGLQNEQERVELYHNISATLQLIYETERPDILLVSAYFETQNMVTTVLRDMNWSPKLVVFSPFLQNNYRDLLDAEYMVGTSFWNPELDTPGDPYFGTPREFFDNYTQRIGNIPDEIVVVAVNQLLIAQLAIQDAIIHFGIKDGSIPTSDQIIFSMARMATTTFSGDVFFDKFGALVSEWVAIQLVGDGPPTDSYANYTANVKRQDGNVSSYYPYSTIISPLEYRTGSLIYPAPTYEEREEHLGYYEGEDSAVEIAFTVLAAVMILIILISAIIVIAWRQENGIRMGQPEFMVLALLGFAVICASIFTWQLYVTTVGCVYTVWLISLGLYFVLGSQIVRTWRVYRIMEAASKLKKYKFPLWLSLVIFMVGYIPVLITLIVLTGRGALSAEIVVDDIRPINNYAECVLDSPDPSPEIIIVIAYLGLLALVWISSALISYKILHSQYALHEIVVSILCCILIIVCGIVLLLAQLLDLDRTSQYIVRCVMILTCSMSYSMAIIYKIYDTLKNGTGLMSIGSNLTNKPSSGGIGSSLDGVTSVHSSDEIASSTSVPMNSVVATNT